MAAHWTLPLLQRELDALQTGMTFRLCREDVTELFGLNSAAVGRITNFADGHKCKIMFRNGDAIFRKAREVQ